MQRLAAKVLIAVVLLALTLSTAISHGGGLIDTLPKDGAWAKYKLTTGRTSTTGRESKRESTITVSSVGKKEIDGKACRWIEISHGGIHRPIAGMLQETTDVDIFLIMEDVFSTDADPLATPVVMMRQASDYENGTPAKVDPRDQRQERHRLVDLHPFLHGKPKDLRELPVKTIECKHGPKECTGIAYEDSLAMKGGSRYETKYEVWLHNDAPFGVVEMNIERRLVRKDESQMTETFKLTLSEVGDGANRVIQE